MDDSLCIDANDLGNLGLISLTCLNSTDTQKQAQIDSQMAFAFE